MDFEGLITGTCLASLGHEVICGDPNKDTIDDLNQGNFPFWEHGLDQLMEEGVSQGNLIFTTDLALTIRSSPVIFLCVNTSSLGTIIEQVEKHSEGRKFLVIKSKVPIGTGDYIARKLQQKENAPYVIDVIANPGFLREGRGIEDFFNPGRIIIGSNSPESRNIMESLYEGINAPLFFCRRKEGELIHFATNSYLALKMSFMNMMAPLCEQAEIDIDRVAKGMGMDPRIDSAFLEAGLGYGGPSLPDVLECFWKQAKNKNVEFPLLAATHRINEQQPKRVIEKLKNHLGSLKGKKITLLGLSYKPMTDEIRHAPSLSLSHLLLKEGAILQAYDPFVRKYPIKEVQICEDLYESLLDSDGAVFVTHWPSFRHIRWDLAAKQMKGHVIIDGRNIFSLEEMKNVTKIHGFLYDSVGRPCQGGI